MPTNILFANSNGPNNQRFADMLSVEVTSMMNGYRWDWDCDTAKHEFLIILQISPGHTNLYISDLGVIVQKEQNKHTNFTRKQRLQISPGRTNLLDFVELIVQYSKEGQWKQSRSPVFAPISPHQVFF